MEFPLLPYEDTANIFGTVCEIFSQHKLARENGVPFIVLACCRQVLFKRILKYYTQDTKTRQANLKVTTQPNANILSEISTGVCALFMKNTSESLARLGTSDLRSLYVFYFLIGSEGKERTCPLPSKLFFILNTNFCM